MNALESGLYRATVRGVPDQIMMVDGATSPYCRTIENIGGDRCHDPRDITDARPLIVLDIEDPRRFAAQLRGVIGGGPDFISAAEHIEAQIRSRRMTEPGSLGVVEAGDEMRDVWFHSRLSGARQWVCVDTLDARAWDDLIDPTLIRDGMKVD